jgi:hypothetical protein
MAGNDLRPAVLLARERPFANLWSFDALDNAQITIGTLSQGEQRLLIPRAVMRRDGLGEVIELNEHGALSEPTFINARRQATRKEAATGCLQCRPRELGIRCQRRFVTYRTVRGNPICLSHGPCPNILERSQFCSSKSCRSSIPARFSAAFQIRSSRAISMPHITITPKRWAVHSAVHVLINAGLTKPSDDGRVQFPYDAVDVAFVLSTAA